MHLRNVQMGDVRAWHVRAAQMEMQLQFLARDGLWRGLVPPRDRQEDDDGEVKNRVFSLTLGFRF